MDTLLNTIRDLTYLHDWLNYIRDDNNIHGENGVKQRVINAIEAVVRNGGITTGTQTPMQLNDPNANIVDTRLYEAIGLLSYLYSRNNYTIEGNIVGVKQHLIRTIEDMVKINTTRTRAITFERIMGLPPHTMNYLLSHEAVTPPALLPLPTPRYHLPTPVPGPRPRARPGPRPRAKPKP